MGKWVADGRTNRPTEVLDTDARPALLSGFNGLDPNGNWTVFVADVAGGRQPHAGELGIGDQRDGRAAAPPVATISGKVKLQAYLGSSRMVRFIASAVSGGVTNYLQTNDVSLSFSGGGGRLQHRSADEHDASEREDGVAFAEAAGGDVGRRVGDEQLHRERTGCWAATW